MPTIYMPSATSQRVYRSPLLQDIAGLLLTSDTALFVYLGRVDIPLTPKHVEFHVVTGGVGAQTAEVGFFSTPAPPNKAGQNLTKLVATGTVDDLTGTGVKRNTAAFTTGIPIGTNLWAGIRTAMATTQPTILALAGDMAQGYVLATAGAGVLTAAGPWAGAIIAAAVAAQAADLRAVLD